jgi:hypothetical protein
MYLLATKTYETVSKDTVRTYNTQRGRENRRVRRKERE